jgi:hypothetical protein
LSLHRRYGCLFSGIRWQPEPPLEDGQNLSPLSHFYHLVTVMIDHHHRDFALVATRLAGRGAPSMPSGLGFAGNLRDGIEYSDHVRVNLVPGNQASQDVVVGFPQQIRDLANADSHRARESR